MPITWTLIDRQNLVDAAVSGSPTLDEFRMYIAEVTAAGASGYGKLVDMRHAAVDLRSADIRALAFAVIAQTERADRALGPVAIVVDAEASLDFTMLFDNRSEGAHRLLAIFASRQMAASAIR